MEELVADLSSALERTKDPPSAHSDTTIATCDSPTSTPVRKAPKKRRARRKRRSDYPTLWDPSKVSEGSNDSMEEALKDYIENISMCQSDEDEEESASVQTRRMSTVFISQESHVLPERAESDSLGEGVIAGLTKRRNKRKRKLRRLSEKAALISSNPLPSRKRKLYCGVGKDNALGENGVRTCGEPYYKLPPSRSQADGSANCEDFNMDDSSLTADPPSEDAVMVASGSDSTSSGNESDQGFFTNDEGRLGDDEAGESTFEHDPKINPWWDDDKLHSDMEEDKFQKILNGVLDEYSIPGPSREGTGGGLQARPKSKHAWNKKESSALLLMELNRRITAFLQDHRKTELWLPTSSDEEKQQIRQLASLYSLCCLTERNSKWGTMILTKTRKSCEPDQHLLSSFLEKESRERRDDRPMAVVRRKKRDGKVTAVPFGKLSGPIPEDNIGNQMLRDMGWTPGTGLGVDGGGIVQPVTAIMRPKGLGLGHPWPS